MKNFTLTLRQDVADWLRIEAAKADLSMSAFVSRMLEEHMGRGKDQLAALEHFLSGAGFAGIAADLPKRDEIFMTGRLFVDTNILIYALDPADPPKRAVSADLLRQTISNHTLTLSPQSLNECYRVLTQRRRLMPVGEARAFVRLLAPWAIAPLDATTTERAWVVQDDAGLSWWDSLMVAAALRAECRLFVSEDMQDGAAIDGMRITNPFKPEFSRLLGRN